MVLYVNSIKRSSKKGSILVDEGKCYHVFQWYVTSLRRNTEIFSPVLLARVEWNCLKLFFQTWKELLDIYIFFFCLCMRDYAVRQ